MQITIHNHRKLVEIQEEFSKEFPCLKLHFFRKPNKHDEPSVNKLLVADSSKTIGQCRATDSAGTLSIEPHHTVADMKRNFQKNFGLDVQVYRKVGDNEWLETVPDIWSLEKHNTLVTEANAEDTLVNL